MAEFKHNNELRDHEVEVAHIEATTDSEIGSETCPLCRKHCLLSEPSCPKGEAYAARSL